MRSRLRHAVSLYALTLLAGFVLVACTRYTEDTTPPQPPEPAGLTGQDEAAAVEASPGPGNDELIIHVPVRVRTLNPFNYRYSHEKWIMQYIHSYLYILDKKTMELVPELATALPAMSEDKLVWTIHLRRDARWHDGKPVTARDVVASFRLMRDPTVDAAKMRTFDNLKSVEALDEDEYTCRFTYSEPYYFARLALLDFPVLPAHVIEQLEKPADWNDLTDVMGCGPYKLDPESRSQVNVTLVRNDDWFGEKPNLKRITYRVISDMTAALRELKRGDVDAMGVTYDQWRLDVSRDKELLGRVQQLSYLRFSFKFLAWNCSRSLFSDKRTRQALTMLLDVQSYLEDNFYPGSKRLTGPFFFKSDQHDDSVVPLPYDPPRAVELLEQVGWKDSDGDGILDRGGEKFEFGVVFLPGLSTTENLVESLKDACGKVGIQVALKPLDSAALSAQLEQGDFDCLAYGLATLDPELDPYLLFHTDAIGSGNYCRFSNPEVDRLSKQARVEFDDEKRNELYHRLHRVLHEEQPFTFLLVPEYRFLVDKRFRNVRSYPLGLTPRIGIEWWVAPGEERRAR